MMHNEKSFPACDRRSILKALGIGTASGVLGVFGAMPSARAAGISKAPHSGGSLPSLKIRSVKAIGTAPQGANLVIVKVETNEPGLYGLGCATFTQRARVVETAIDKYLKPFLIGKDPLQIEDIFQSSFVSSYWRNGPVLGNALSGVDMALWDILGKRAGLPVYQLLGGKCREAVDTYRHASGKTFQDVEDSVAKYKAEGYRHIRIQSSVPGLATYGTGGATGSADEKTASNRRVDVWEPGPYVRL